MITSVDVVGSLIKQLRLPLIIIPQWICSVWNRDHFYRRLSSLTCNRVKISRAYGSPQIKAQIISIERQIQDCLWTRFMKSKLRSKELKLKRKKEAYQEPIPWVKGLTVQAFDRGFVLRSPWLSLISLINLIIQ